MSIAAVYLGGAKITVGYVMVDGKRLSPSRYVFDKDAGAVRFDPPLERDDLSGRIVVGYAGEEVVTVALLGKQMPPEEEAKEKP